MWDLDADRPTVAQINLANLSHNITSLRRRLGDTQEIMAVVKADAYGHGAERVSNIALNSGATWLGVALVDEGVALRKAGIIAPILILGGIFPSVAKRAIRYGLSCAVASMDVAEALSLAATQEGKRAKIHIKVDTGMGRLGVAPGEALEFVRNVERLPNMEVEGIFTHLAMADDPDTAYTKGQIRAFLEVLRALEHDGIHVKYKHIANSAAVISMIRGELEELWGSGLNLVRLGIIIYGLSPYSEEERFIPVKKEFDLRPALSLRTRVSFSKRVGPGTRISYGGTYTARQEERIVTLPIGYADGLPRALSNKGSVLIRGIRYPLVGTICMDQCMAAVGDSDIETGEEAVIIGEQGEEEITCEEVARLASTITYEITCGISKRVPRVYLP